MVANCKKTCKLCNGGSGSCKDLKDKCGRWAAAGYCDAQGDYFEKFMLKNCKKTCKFCWKKSHPQKILRTKNSHKVKIVYNVLFFKKKNFFKQPKFEIEWCAKLEMGNRVLIMFGLKRIC